MAKIFLIRPYRRVEGVGALLRPCNKRAWLSVPTAVRRHNEGRDERAAMTEVLENLIGNALKHGNAEGPIQVRLDGSESDYVTLAVTNGGTIPPDVLPHLFDPFRGGPRQSGRGEGLGLGLYIVSQIVQAHDGRVDVKTGNGETTFQVQLPREDPSPQSDR